MSRTVKKVEDLKARDYVEIVTDFYPDGTFETYSGEFTRMSDDREQVRLRDGAYKKLDLTGTVLEKLYPSVLYVDLEHIHYLWVWTPDRKDDSNA